MGKVTCEHSGIEFESKDGWNKVEDCLPKNDEYVLAFYIESPCNMCLNWYSHLNKKWMIDYLTSSNPTHWHPLPNLPKD